MFNDCFTCEITHHYVQLANQFTQDLSQVLLTPMWAIFLGIAGLWVISHGFRMVLGKPDVFGFFHEFLFLVIAAALLSGQGPGLVDLIYKSALATISGAASAVLTAGGGISVQTGVSVPAIPGVSGIQGLDGIAGLVQVAHNGVFKVFGMAQAMLSYATLTNPSPIIFAVLMLLPYGLLLIVYFAQVVVTIFRVMMFAALSPILMVALGFGWGKDVALNGVRTLFAAFMVLYGATIALAVCLYGVSELGIGTAGEGAAQMPEILALNNPKLWVAIALGWLGTAFMAEATGMANSIAGSKLTNQAAAVITAGAVATGAYAVNRARGQWGGALSGAAGGVASGLATGAGGLVSAGLNPGNAAQAAAGKISPGAQKVMDRIRNPNASG